MIEILNNLNDLIYNYNPKMLKSLSKVELFHLYGVGVIDNDTLNKYLKGAKK